MFIYTAFSHSTKVVYSFRPSSFRIYLQNIVFVIWINLKENTWNNDQTWKNYFIRKWIQIWFYYSSSKQGGSSQFFQFFFHVSPAIILYYVDHFRWFLFNLGVVPYQLSQVLTMKSLTWSSNSQIWKNMCVTNGQNIPCHLCSMILFVLKNGSFQSLWSHKRYLRKDHSARTCLKCVL